jgi:hypothetical protein
VRFSPHQVRNQQQRQRKEAEQGGGIQKFHRVT